MDNEMDNDQIKEATRDSIEDGLKESSKDILEAVDKAISKERRKKLFTFVFAFILISNLAMFTFTIRGNIYDESKRAIEKKQSVIILKSDLDALYSENMALKDKVLKYETLFNDPEILVTIETKQNIIIRNQAEIRKNQKQIPGIPRKIGH